MMKRLLLLMFLFAGQLAGQADNIEKIKSIVNKWSDAHNARDYEAFNTLFASKLLFYTVDQDKSRCIAAKRKAFEVSPNFYQEIVSPIKITFYESGTIKCSFSKEVHAKKTKTYSSYLLLKAENETYLIIGESDNLTDSNLNFKLNLGNQLITSNAESQSFFSFHFIAIAFGVILLIILLFIIFKPTRRGRFNMLQSNNISTANVSNDSSSTERIGSFISKVSSSAATHNTKQLLNKTFNQTKTFTTKLFDSADNIDRMLYGIRMKLFIAGCFLVLFIAPLVDYFIGEDGWITFLMTLIFLLFILVLVFSFIGSWRDDNGNVTWERTKARLRTYYAILNDTLSSTKASSQIEILYRLGVFLFLGGVAWRAIQNVSLLIRKIADIFGGALQILIEFEKFTSQFFWIPITLGVSILLYLYNSNTLILYRIKSEIRQFFGVAQNSNSKYSTEIVSINATMVTDLVINAKEERHLTEVMAMSNSMLFNDFAMALQNWNPRGATTEFHYQDRLLRHLKKILPEASIESEYPLQKFSGRKGRADIVINDSILIELKKDSSAGGIQRAIGQVGEYSTIWQNKGPVILLLCDYDFEHAKAAYLPLMQDQMKLGRPVLTIVAKVK